jgi:hypothetical protein
VSDSMFLIHTRSWLAGVHGRDDGHEDEEKGRGGPGSRRWGDARHKPRIYSCKVADPPSSLVGKRARSEEKVDAAPA